MPLWGSKLVIWVLLGYELTHWVQNFLLWGATRKFTSAHAVHVGHVSCRKTFQLPGLGEIRVLNKGRWAHDNVKLLLKYLHVFDLIPTIPFTDTQTSASKKEERETIKIDLRESVTKKQEEEESLSFEAIQRILHLAKDDKE